ncbi:MAG: hypothetical protein AB7N61_25720 [Acidimicrobiia bacterium]
MKNTLKITLAGALAAGVLITATPAFAQGSTDPNRPRVAAICARVPNVETRTSNLIARLEGDASTQGSLAWLQTKVDQATTAGRTELAEALQNRLDFRTAKLEVLKKRIVELGKLSDWCDAHAGAKA